MVGRDSDGPARRRQIRWRRRRSPRPTERTPDRRGWAARCRPVRWRITGAPDSRRSGLPGIEIGVAGTGPPSDNDESLNTGAVAPVRGLPDLAVLGGDEDVGPID